MADTIQGERNVCRKRKPFHVFEQDSQGYYTIETFDPLASVISYLRDERYRNSHSSNVDLIRVYSLIDAIDLCNAIANGRNI
jgi:hypothetical protein